MASMTGCGQNGLKNGVYEFYIPPDELIYHMLQVSSRRTLIVKDDIVLYNILETIPWDAKFGDYYLKLEKHSDSLYKAKNENIELIIMIVDSNTIGVDVITGFIRDIYSGGAYWDRIIVLPPEKQTLTFVRELTPENEENLSREREKIENKIIPEKS